METRLPSRTRLKVDSNPPVLKTVLERKCRYCKGLFRPAANQTHQAFCKPAHRKLYWKYGTLPFDKLMDRVRKEIPKMIGEASIPEAIMERLSALESRFKAISDAARGGGAAA